ncbi:MAG: hypothetical protein LBD53_04310 [Tannerella sp.]|jgi:hypothetical protein|nr:hypothetical protein [Tannerella sp.]
MSDEQYEKILKKQLEYIDKADFTKIRKEREEIIKTYDRTHKISSDRMRQPYTI